MATDRIVVPSHMLRIALRHLPVLQSPHVVFVVGLARLLGGFLEWLSLCFFKRDVLFCFDADRCLQSEVVLVFGYLSWVFFLLICLLRFSIRQIGIL